MKLGKKGKDVESFVDKLVKEGESKKETEILCTSLFDVTLQLFVFFSYLLSHLSLGVASVAAAREPVVSSSKAATQAVAHERYLCADCGGGGF